MGRSKSFLFVCTGNICRSPMAEVLTRRLLDEFPDHIDVTSAGTLGIQNAPAARHARETVQELGLDLNYHRSRGISRALVEDQDACLVMEPDHEAFLKHHHESGELPLIRLWEHANQSDEVPETTLAKIPDPQGKGLEEFRHVRDLILAAVRHWLRLEGMALETNIPSIE